MTGDATPAVRDGAVLVIDTATTRVVVALAAPDGAIRATASWDAGYRHGETLLPSSSACWRTRASTGPSCGASSSGPGPGRSPACASGSRRPRVWPTASACRSSASRRPRRCLRGGRRRRAARRHRRSPAAPVLLLPAGPSDRIVVRPGSPPGPAPGGDEPDLAPGEWLVAVDLADRAPADAVRQRGEAARDGLADELAALGRCRGWPTRPTPTMARRSCPSTSRCRAGSLAEQGEVAWSRDPR